VRLATIPRIQTAKTLELTARLPAMCHMLSAMKLPENVHHAIQQRTRTAQTLKALAEQNAKRRPNQSVITAPENATHVLMDKVA